MLFLSLCVLDYDGYSYRFNFEDIAEAVAKKFPGLPLDFSRMPRANCSVYNGQLYLNSLKLFVLSKNLGKALCYGHYPSYQRKERLVPGKYLYDIEDSYSVLYENLHIPLVIDNTVSARQIFVDEVEFMQTPHEEVSTFVFDHGKLDFDRSRILQSDEKLIERFTWRDGMEKDLMDDEISEMGTCRIFFIDPVGTLAQNHHVINAVAAYRRCPGFEKPAVESILRYKTPVMRTEYMRETRPRSLKFEYCCDDVREIISQYLRRRNQDQGSL